MKACNTVCCIEGCGAKLSHRNKYGYCKLHRNLSPQFKAIRSTIQARFYRNLSPEERELRKLRTQKFKDSKRTQEQLDRLNYVRSLSPSERQSLFKRRKKEYNARYEKDRKQRDLCFKIAKNLRSRLSKMISMDLKKCSSVANLGCSLEEFKRYLESKFQPGMTWDNYGKNGWHIDHIRPLCSFDLTDPEQVKLACHYTNLQPLWWYDNLSKISKDKEIKYGKQMDEEDSR